MSKFFDYLDSISQVNGLTNGMGNGQKIQWLFHCGMLFLSKDKWWGDFKFRHCAHEGMDIIPSDRRGLGQTGTGRIVSCLISILQNPD